MRCRLMSALGLGRVKTFLSLELRSFEEGQGFWAGYALIAAISGRTPMMLITLVML